MPSVFNYTILTILNTMLDDQNKQDAEKYRIFREADQKFAIKLVERIVFSIVALVGVALVGAFLKSYFGI